MARAFSRVAGKYEPLDGVARPRNVILEFESYDQAKAYFNSPEYQAAREHRIGGSTGELSSSRDSMVRSPTSTSVRHEECMAKAGIICIGSRN